MELRKTELQLLCWNGWQRPCTDMLHTFGLPRLSGLTRSGSAHPEQYWHWKVKLDPGTYTLYRFPTNRAPEAIVFLRKYFYRKVKAIKGETPAKTVITDKVPLEREGCNASLLPVFINPADIGGRYSALSILGIVPAALIGHLDLDKVASTCAGNARSM